MDNTKRKAKRRIDHLMRVALYRGDLGGYAAAIRGDEQSKAMSMADTAKASYEALSYWERFKLFISKIFSRYAT